MATFGDLLHDHSPETTLEIGKKYGEVPEMHGAYRGLANESRIQPLSCLHIGWSRPAGNLSCLVPLRQYEHLEPYVKKTAVNRFTARLREGNVIPATLLR